MYKKELRKIYKEKRKELTDIEMSSFQEKIYQQIFNFDFSTIQKVHVFLPIEKQKEINTYPIIHFLRKQGKDIVISKSDFSNTTLTHFLFEKETELQVNKYGIPEPLNAKEVVVKDIDLVFVPLLISDKQNYRVGYGKGFYDRFLNDCKKSTITIGINFFKPIDVISDVNTFDIPLNHIITPE